MNSTLDFPIQAQADLYPVGWSRLGGLQLLSLDVILRKCDEFYRVCSDLADASVWLSRLDPPDKLLDGGDADFCIDAIKGAVNLLASLGVTDGPFAYDVKITLDHVASLRGGVWGGLWDVRANVLAHDYARIRQGVLEELKRHYFVYLPSPGEKYLSQERLFGDAVYEAFPSARYDIRESGNALAFQMYTACVFHLMRVAEHGLRALAEDREVQFKTKSGSPYPIDMGTWEEILTALGQEADRIGSWQRALGEIRHQAQKFYGSSIEELRAIKDSWRNPTMHARDEHLMEDANQVMAHVKRLMVTLSSRISETERTPKVWTDKQLR